MLHQKVYQLLVEAEAVRKQKFLKLLEAIDIDYVASKNPNIDTDLLYDIFGKVGKENIKYVVPFARIFNRNAYDLDLIPELMNRIVALKKKPDVNAFKTIQDLEQEVSSLEQSVGVTRDKGLSVYNPYDQTGRPVESRTVSWPPKGTNDFKLVFESGDWKVFSPQSLDATSTYTPMKYFGWCTAGSIHYPSYKNGDLYIFVKGSEARGQFYISSNKETTEFTKPSKNPNVNADTPAVQEPINVDKFIESNPVFEKFFDGIGYVKKERFEFDGRTFNYTVDDEGYFVFDTINISDMRLNSLKELPWVV
jgi:hypothetical protein